MAHSPQEHKNTFSAHITGIFNITEAGSYDFASWSDDGISFLIDDAQVISRPNPHGPKLDIGNLFLSTGLHSIDVIWYENYGAAVLELSSKSANSDDWQLLKTITPPVSMAVPEPSIIWYLLIGAILITLQRKQQFIKQAIHSKDTLKEIRA